MKKNNKKFLIIAIIIAALAVGYLKFGFAFVTQSAPSLSTKEIESQTSENFVPTFAEAIMPYIHELSGKKPFTGSALIDIDGDGIDEVFIGGGVGQEDALLKYTENGFKNIIEGSGLSNTEQSFAVISLDVDNDDDTDLIMNRKDGVYIYENKDGKFSDKVIFADFEDCAQPFGLGAGDINKDGAVDLYVTTFKCPEQFKTATFNDPTVRSKNVMLLNNGDNSFSDITEKSGLTYDQNTFIGTFIDLNSDGWQDLVITPNTDRVRIYKNNGDNTFELVAQPTGYGFWMGNSFADIDHDGDQDMFFTNSGTTIPDAQARGDLKANQKLQTTWSLLRNDGDFNFTEISDEAEVAEYEFAWGAQFADLNLDAQQDLLVAQNYVKLPAHRLKKLPGRVLLQNDGKFIPAGDATGAKNPYFGQVPLTTDFNQDGYSDIVYTNINGPSRILMNNGVNANYLTVVMPDNTQSIGAVLKLKTRPKTLMESIGTVLEGKTPAQTLTKQIVAGTGLLSDQSAQVTFGLGNDREIDSLEITFPNGKKLNFTDIEPNIEMIIQ